MANREMKWMQQCISASKTFSTCAKRKYAAFIIDKHGFTVGFGYNGVPKGMEHCDANGCPRFLEQVDSKGDYDNCYSIHAESNALLHSDYTARRDGCTLVVNGEPCFWCAKLIANSGVDRLVYLSEVELRHDRKWNQTERFLVDAGVQLVPVTKEQVDIYERIGI